MAVNRHETGTSTESFNLAGEPLVTALAYSPDGQLIATAAHRDVVQLWNAQTHEDAGPGPIAVTLSHADVYIKQLAFSPDGTRLAILANVTVTRFVGLRAVPRVWTYSMETGELRWGPHLRSQYKSVYYDEIHSARVEWSPDGAHIAETRSDSIILWEVAHDSIENTIMLPTKVHHGIVTALSMSPDGRNVALGCEDQEVQMYTLCSLDVKTSALLFLVDYAHDNTITSINYSLDGLEFVTGSRDGTLKIWDTLSGTAKVVLENSTPIEWVRFSPDCKTVFSGDNRGSLRGWDPSVSDSLKFGPISTVPYGAPVGISAYSLSADGRQAAVAIYHQYLRETRAIDLVMIWDMSNATRIHPQETMLIQIERCSSMNTLSWFPGGKRLLISERSDKSKSIHTWDTQPIPVPSNTGGNGGADDKVTTSQPTVHQVSDHDATASDEDSFMNWPAVPKTRHLEPKMNLDDIEMSDCGSVTEPTDGERVKKTADLRRLWARFGPRIYKTQWKERVHAVVSVGRLTRREYALGPELGGEGRYPCRGRYVREHADDEDTPSPSPSRSNSPDLPQQNGQQSEDNDDEETIAAMPMAKQPHTKARMNLNDIETNDLDAVGGSRGGERTGKAVSVKPRRLWARFGLGSSGRKQRRERVHAVVSAAEGFRRNIALDPESGAEHRRASRERRARGHTGDEDISSSSSSRDSSMRSQPQTKQQPEADNEEETGQAGWCYALSHCTCLPWFK
ncbi:WD40 repeat-like protein [Coniophora puteana RWD-64-598 SS2]|uniref:WD40 repeat-like protein n=1 Tax=Coniophora puteana (strain RWD-64-598) TaxID=741705 RepID=A0A5M3MUC4_CONPW|nr:WD40 repeat-like protein [Coniophora puteana RWD-64-598 SS2]EIW82650.1 WD40 repeat-like protein [Coniophora puteana RWD-64-598 SS2]